MGTKCLKNFTRKCNARKCSLLCNCLPACPCTLNVIHPARALLFGPDTVVCNLFSNSGHLHAGEGEAFSKSQHVQGTEVKAITYSAMQVIETDQKTDIYVIVDI